MNKLMLAAAGVMIGSTAVAQGAGGVVLTNPEFGTGFSNRGQCVSTLAKVRNSQRANPATRGEAYRNLSTSDFQRESLRTTRCEMIDGKYRVVFYVNGFPA